jgi:hypothetical protein
MPSRISRARFMRLGSRLLNSSVDRDQRTQSEDFYHIIIICPLETAVRSRSVRNREKIYDTAHPQRSVFLSPPQFLQQWRLTSEKRVDKMWSFGRRFSWVS